MNVIMILSIEQINRQKSNKTNSEKKKQRNTITVCSLFTLSDLFWSVFVVACDCD